MKFIHQMLTASISINLTSYLRLDPCLECLDERAKVSASWLSLDSKKEDSKISYQAPHY